MEEIQKLNVNEIITIKKLPEIYYQLEKVGQFIDKELQGIDELECTEVTKQMVKNKRTEINNTLKEFEEARKGVKEKILEGYNLFEDKYTKEVKTRLESASNCLKTKIDYIETQQRDEKRNKLIDFFEQWKEYYHLEDIVKFEDLKLNITLSASETSLKNQIKDSLEKISEDLVAISSDENREEILFEYKKNDFNYTKAVNIVNVRHKELEELKKKSEELSVQREQEIKVIENVNTLCSAPIEIKEESEEIIEVTFTIKTSKDKILKLKDYLKEMEIDYE